MSIQGARPTGEGAHLSRARRAVLDRLREADRPCTVTQVAADLGQHPNTAREHLEGLVAAGLAARDTLRSRARGRPASVYRATSAASSVSAEYAVLAEVLVEHLVLTWPDQEERGARAREAGTTWGRALRARQPRSADAREDGSTSAARELLATLTDAGFDPVEEVAEDGTQTHRLQRCPVLTLARAHPDVVCAAHLGMAQEIVGAHGVGADRVSLEPFAEPGACLLHVSPAPGRGPVDGPGQGGVAPDRTDGR